MDAIEFPEEGMDHETVLHAMRTLRDDDIKWHDNRAFSLVFHKSDEHGNFLKEAHNMFSEGNGLNPMAFASLRTFEHEVIRMTADLLNGDDETVGAMTSGGTESIMLAVKTYRDRARKVMPWIKKPEIIIPDSAHVAFNKAGKYFDVSMIPAPLNKDFRVDVGAVKRLITPNTIALVGSAPDCPSGVIDPIQDLAILAEKHGIGLHVDCCIGGFLLPFLEELGCAIPPFDFRIPGVTSISADLHKYGYAAKGASTILYRSMDYMRYQFFICVDWPGGIYASPSMPGTRPGGTIAAAWATLKTMGRSGYLENARVVMDTTRRFTEGINAIPGLKVLGNPPASVFAYTTTDPDLNCYVVADFMAERGWHIDRQQKPASIHLMINPGHATIVDAYLADLGAAVAFNRENPDAAVSGSAPAYGLIANAPARSLVAGNVLKMMEDLYSAKGTLPQLSGDAGPAVPGFVMKLMKLKNRFDRFLKR